MRASFRSFRSCSSSILVLAGTCALLVLVVVLLTPGFLIAIGPFRLSAHRWTGPFLVSALAWAAAALLGRRELGDASRATGLWLDRYAPAIAAVIAAATAGIGLAFGTYAAGADAAGYVSQAELIVRPNGPRQAG